VFDRARIALARRADFCVTPSVARARSLAREAGIPVESVIVVPNFPGVADIRSFEKVERREFRLHYHGTIVRQRLPLTILGALAKVPRFVSLEVFGYAPFGSLRYPEEFEAEASRLGLTDRVTVSDPLPRSSILDRCAEADAGLAIVCPDPHDINLQLLAGTSNKVYAYLACGIPVIVPADPTWEIGVVADGVGVSCDPEDPVSIADAIEFLASDRTLCTAMGEAGRLRILERDNYESAFDPVVRHILSFVRLDTRSSTGDGVM